MDNMPVDRVQPDPSTHIDSVTDALRDGGTITRRMFMDMIRASNDLTPETLARRCQKSRNLKQVECKMTLSNDQDSVTETVVSSRVYRDWARTVNPETEKYRMTDGQIRVLLYLLSFPMTRKGNRMVTVTYNSKIGMEKPIAGESFEVVNAQACDGPSLAILPSMPGSGKSPVAMAYLLYMTLSDGVWAESKRSTARIDMGMIGASDMVTRTIRVGRVNMSSVEMTMQMLSEFIPQLHAVPDRLKEGKNIEVWIDTVPGTAGNDFADEVNTIICGMDIEVLFHGTKGRDTARFISDPTLVVFWFGVSTHPASMNMSKRANDKKRKYGFDRLVETAGDIDSVTEVLPLVTVTDEGIYRHNGMHRRNSPFLHCLLLSGVPALIATAANVRRSNAKSVDPIHDLFSPEFRSMCDDKAKLSSETVRRAFETSLKLELLSVPTSLVSFMEDDAAEMMPEGVSVTIVKAVCTRMASKSAPIRGTACVGVVSVVDMLMATVPPFTDNRAQLVQSAQSLVELSKGVVATALVQGWVRETDACVVPTSMHASFYGSHTCGCGAEEGVDNTFVMGCCTGVVCGSCVRVKGECCYHCMTPVTVAHSFATKRMYGALHPANVEDMVNEPIDVFPTIKSVVEFALRPEKQVRLLVYGSDPSAIVSLLTTEGVDVSEVKDKGRTDRVARYRDRTVTRSQILVSGLSSKSTSVTGLNFPDTDGIVVVGDSPLLPQILGRVMRPGGSNPNRIIDMTIIRTDN